MKRREWHLVAGLVVGLAVVTAGVVAVTRTTARPCVVVGRSMEPTLFAGDRVIVDLHAYRRHPPESGDVVVVRTADGVELVKRVSGTNSDRRREHEPERIWLLGDNRDLSLDSREIGPVLRSEIVGQVSFRYWPPSRAGSIEYSCRPTGGFPRPPR